MAPRSQASLRSRRPRDDRCPQLFASYIGIAFDVSRLEMLYLYPSEDTWGQGDRQIACIATGSDGEQLTGTLAGGAPVITSFARASTAHDA